MEKTSDGMYNKRIILFRLGAQTLRREELLQTVVDVIQRSEAYEQLPDIYKQQLDAVMNRDYLLQAIAKRNKPVPKQGEKTTVLYQLKIALKGIRPPVWRRIVVPSHITFDQLHDIIQLAMGWENSHLYEFEINDIVIDIPDEEYGFSFVGWREKYDARAVELSRFVKKEGEKFTYTYDFGDNWVHLITLEKIETTTEPFRHPVCLKGKRACPPEDVGGIYGYMEVMDLLDGNRSEEEMEEFTEWYGGEYDPEHFDIEEVNQQLRAIVFF